MILSHCTHETVLHVAMNMRAADAEEIYGLRWEDNPFVITNEVMAQRDFAWVAWHDNKPAIVIGGAPLHPGVWQVFCFGTDDWRRLALPITRFTKKNFVPKLWELGARRLQADSHQNHTDAHNWLRRLGAAPESVRKGYGRDGADYLHFVLRSGGETES